MVTGVTTPAATSLYTTGNADYFFCRIYTEYSEHDTVPGTTLKKIGLAYLRFNLCDKNHVEMEFTN